MSEQEAQKTQVEFFDLVRKLKKKEYKRLIGLIKARDRANKEITDYVNLMGVKYDSVEQSKRTEERRKRKNRAA